ncbi:MAG: hypothetical protein ACLFNI_02865 [Natronomonas sp.]
MAARYDDGEIQARDLNILTRGLSGFVPQAVATRGVTISIETDRDAYDVGDTVDITVTIRNRIPFPIEVVTTGQRIWGWRVNDLLEASDETLYEPTTPRRFSMQARETITVDIEWDGRFKRDGSPTRWEPADAGEHEIDVFLAVDPPKTDAKTVEFR